MKHILITNDDGYESEGLKALIDAVRPLAKITVVAPATQKSACGHSITLTRPLSFVSVDDDFYKLDDGTPSDCVYLAIHSLFGDKKPDLVISGINRGSNMGEDITYSGTAAAAMEAVLHDIPAVAISQVIDFNNPVEEYALASKSIAALVKRIFDDEFPLDHREFLNINVPHSCSKLQFKVTHAGYRCYANDAHLHRNPRGVEYYWLGLHPLEFKRRLDRDTVCDFEAVESGFVSVTPIMLDLTAYSATKRLEEWL